MSEPIINSAFLRTQMLLGGNVCSQLQNATVAVFGIGGVGSFTVEALVRSGVGHLILIDNDTICVTNLNRQLPATTKTIGMLKIDVMAERAKEINPLIQVTTHEVFVLTDNIHMLLHKGIDYVVDAVDTVTAKIAIALKAQELGIPIISCMGTGNKINPSLLQIGDIYQTTVCPLCKVMRHELRKRNVTALKVLYSTEIPLQANQDLQIKCGEECTLCHIKGSTQKRHSIPGSVSFVPSAAGLIIAGEVIRELIKI